MKTDTLTHLKMQALPKVYDAIHPLHQRLQDSWLDRGWETNAENHKTGKGLAMCEMAGKIKTNKQKGANWTYFGNVR